MITFICGQLCCGKTSFARSYAAINDCTYVELGDIVRRIKQSQDRQELQNSKELAHEIAREIKHIEKEVFPKGVVASGPRQIEILQEFPDSTLLWIECPPATRQARYSFRARTGDSVPFDVAEQGDIDLGILKVKDYVFQRTYY